MPENLGSLVDVGRVVRHAGALLAHHVAALVALDPGNQNFTHWHFCECEGV